MKVYEIVELLKEFNPSQVINETKGRAFDYLVQHEQLAGRTTLISKVLDRVVPFNAPHGFKVEKMSLEEVRVTAPFRRSNWNHIKTVHACAIATLGEMAAGLSIIRRIGINNYRLILKKLTISYFKQATSGLTSVATINQEDFERVTSELSTEHQSTLKITSNIYNHQQELVASVESCWQLKEWDHVTFKSL